MTYEQWHAAAASAPGALAVIVLRQRAADAGLDAFIEDGEIITRAAVATKCRRRRYSILVVGRHTAAETVYEIEEVP